ncbi:YcxB family protein [Croceicoccus marinus]|nr:YcxB family protein [Croceicoccus marinus]
MPPSYATGVITRGPYSYEVTEDMVVEAMRRHMVRRMTHGLVGRLFIAVLALLALLIALDLAFYGRLSRASLAFLVAVPLALAVINLWLVPQLGRRQFRQSAALRAPGSFEWDDGSVRFTSERGEARIRLGELYRWDETANIVLLYQTEMFFNLVPKADLQGEAPELIARLRAAGVKRN